jgi:transformation/transcription domain-associated protein
MMSKGSEETKILSAQMLGIPLLEQNTSNSFFDGSSVEKLIESLLLNDVSYGEKLTCEVLQIITVLLKHKHARNMTIYRQNDLLKFILAVLENNGDTDTKYYAYLAASRFILVFDTPTKLILKVYFSLLRHATERNSVHEALDVLLPALIRQLGNDKLKTLLKFTKQLLVCEENNSNLHIARIWESVTKHPEIYRSVKFELIPHMLHLLLSLVVQSTVPIKQIQLSVDLAKLLYEWVIVGQSTGIDKDLAYLDENTINVLVNHLVRLAFVTVPKQDSHQRKCLQIQIFALMKGLVSHQRNCTINPTLFEFALWQCSHSGVKSWSNLDSSKSKILDCDGFASAFHVCAEIALILLQNDPSNSFLNRYCIMIANQCFQNLNSVPIAKLQDLLFYLLVGSHTSNKIITHIVAVLERALEEGTLSQEELAISVIERVGKKRCAFIEPFVGPLTALVKRLVIRHAKEHIYQSSGTIAVQQIAQNEPQHKLSATPTLGIFQVARGLYFKPSSIGNDVQLSSCGYKTQIKVENVTLGLHVQSLITSMTLVASSDSLFSFSSSRTTFMTILSTILDYSCSIPVLMTAVSIVGQWSLAYGKSSPLTRSEYERFIWQLAFLDLKRLPESLSHVLKDMISCYVLSSNGHNPSMIHEYPYGVDKSLLMTNYYFRDRIAKEEAFQKLFVSSLLSGNPYLRSLSIGIISTHFDDCALDGSISIRCTSDILAGLLHLDYECIGEHLWTTIFIDALLASCRYDAGVLLCRQGLDHQLFATQMTLLVILSGYMKINHTQNRIPDIKVNFRPGEYDGLYSPFVKVLELQRSRKLSGRGYCIAAVRNLVHGDMETCQSMLELCFQSSWNCLRDNQTRATLVKPLERLIARPFNSQRILSCQSGQMNAIQSMLRLLLHLRPMPFVDHFLLLSLSLKYNVRNETLCLIEKMYISRRANNICSYCSSHYFIIAAQKCYDLLGDRDISLALLSSIAQLHSTRFTLSFDTYDLLNQSTNAILSLIDRADERNPEFLPTESEFDLWETRWLESHKEMGQWSVVDQFALDMDDANLMRECAWKTNNWEQVKSLCSHPSTVSSLNECDPSTKITEIYLAVHEGKLEMVENLHWQSAQLCLHQWNLLPTIDAGGNTHSSMFHLFQRLVELRESSQIALETSSHSARRTIPDLKLLLSSWRHRLPNYFERLSQWNDIFLWRLQIFDVIARTFAWTNDLNAIANLHDRPFVYISLSRAARKQGLNDIATYSLDSLRDSEIDVEYEFQKQREHIVNFQFSPAGSLKGGLSLANSANITFFDFRQRAEMFRLKAHFFFKLGEKPKSNQAYCHAVQICPTYARAWIDWGKLCSSLSDDAMDQAKGIKAESNELTEETCLYLVQAMSC